jgi:hypothetical protein
MGAVLVQKQPSAILTQHARFMVRAIDRGGSDRDLNLRAARLRKSLIQVRHPEAI